MRKLIIVIIMLGFVPVVWSQVFTKKKSTQAADAPIPTPAPNTGATKTAVKAPKGMTGTVCTLVGCASGKTSNMTKDDAKKIVAHNELLCLCVGKKCYIVINSDGTNASAKLAEFAGGKVTVAGKTLNKNGMNVIMADSMR